MPGHKNDNSLYLLLVIIIKQLMSFYECLLCARHLDKHFIYISFNHDLITLLSYVTIAIFQMKKLMHK